MTTPDEHIAVLVTMAEDFERCVGYLRDADASSYAKTLRARAAAIRWLLAETAYGVDPEEIVV